MGLITTLLGHPLTRGLSVDDPRTTLLRRRIIAEKPFLRKIYVEWYQRIAAALPKGGKVLELGSGAGFIKEFLPEAITSDIFEVPDVDMVVDACAMPFKDGYLDAIIMTDVLHHIPDVERFFDEARRCIKPGGRIVMIEPWRTPWSEWVYNNLHSEPFEPTSGWTIPASGPLSGANGALPWILFERDKQVFAERFPQWQVSRIEPLMPLAYLVSGGVSLRTLMPGALYPAVRWVEGRLPPDRTAMFALIELDRRA